ncbi:MAG: polyprenol monophosphomannose synthase [Saprospiraceae bacterium]|nr:polyprenol monophosphomannose synthase [Saprospiraceae bacterium]
MTKSLVIIPTYNEKENVAKIIQAVFSLSIPFHILIVDDGSPDGTADIVKDLQKEHSGRLHLLQRLGKQGLGTAYIAGFKWGLENNYDYIFEMDADFSHNPSDLERLHSALDEDGFDLVVGSRYCKGGKVKNWPWDRIFLSFGASLYTRCITWMPVRDPTAGFIGYRSKVLASIPLDKIRFVGYAFQIEMKFSAYLRGFKIKEVPITFVDRVEGVSKLSSGIIHEAVFGVMKMRLKSLLGEYP